MSKDELMEEVKRFNENYLGFEVVGAERLEPDNYWDLCELMVKLCDVMAEKRNDDFYWGNIKLNIENVMKKQGR